MLGLMRDVGEFVSVMIAGLAWLVWICVPFAIGLLIIMALVKFLAGN